MLVHIEGTVHRRLYVMLETVDEPLSKVLDVRA